LVGGHTRFIESDMSVLADTSKEKLDTSITFDSLFISITLRDEILCVSIKDIDLRRWNIN
jgi:hypothetical protein